jgi:hypothetical protein
MAKKKPRRIKGPQKPRDPLLMFLNARGFGLAAQIVNTHPKDKSLLMWPLIANESFALEMYLKCLHRIRRRKIRGHDIGVLFEQLSKADKKTITTYLLDFVRGHRDYLLMFSKGVSFDASDVARRATSFVNARYWSDLDLPAGDEHGFVGNMGVGSLMDAVVRLILELRPDWPEKVANFRFKILGKHLPS